MNEKGRNIPHSSSKLMHIIVFKYDICETMCLSVISFHAFSSLLQSHLCLIFGSNERAWLKIMRQLRKERRRKGYKENQEEKDVEKQRQRTLLRACLKITRQLRRKKEECRKKRERRGRRCRKQMQCTCVKADSRIRETTEKKNMEGRGKKKHKEEKKERDQR